LSDIRDTSVAVVTYNSAAVIRDCLSALRGCAPIWVVDNASQDGTINVAKECCPGVIAIELPENIGFGRAVNRVLERCEGRYVLVLNPDVVLKPDAIKLLVDAGEENPRAWVVAARLFFPDGRPQRSFLPYREGFLPSESAVVVKQVLGAVMLLRRREVLELLGGFDEAFFLYGEDEDLCYRVAGAGGRVLLVPRAEAIHVYGASSGEDDEIRAKKAWHLSWARVRVARKHRGFCAALGYVARVSIVYGYRAAWALVKRDDRAVCECVKRIGGAYAALAGRCAFE